MRMKRLIHAALLLLAAPIAQAETKTDYMAVLMGGKKIGHAKMTRTIEGGKVTTVMSQTMTIGRGDVGMTLRQVEKTVETADGKPLGFEAVQDLGIAAQVIEGTIDPDGKMTVTTKAGGQATTQTSQWPQGALLNEGMRLLSIKKGLKEGTTYSVKTFVPSMMTAMDVTVRVGARKEVDLFGRVVKLTEMTMTFAAQMGQMVLTSYVDDDLDAQKTTTSVMGMEIVMLACTKEFALSPDDIVDFLGKSLLASPSPLPTIKSARSATYRLQPKAGASLSLPGTDCQSVSKQEDGIYVVTVRTVDAPKGATFPYAGDDKDAQAAMKPTRYLQSNDAKVVTLARKAVGDTKDAAEAARKIEAFVADYIKEKSFSVGYATAAEVAESPQGDCSEHSVLVAAMCRAVGIPARVVFGLAYIEQFAGRKNVFGAHAWNEAFIGGKWVPLDATLGFDPGHIALLVGNGDPSEFFGMVGTLGNFSMTAASVGG